MAGTPEPPPSAEAGASPRPGRRPPRPPSLLDALLPIVVLIGLLALTIAFFGIDATNGPLQVALFLSAAFASLIAFKNGYTVAAIRDATVGGVTTAMSAIFILLAVGALIGTWNMAGTIPTVVDYGIRLVSPSWFYVTAAAVCALVGMVTGSSWTTAGTLGVAFVGMAKVLGLEEPIAAGAVICGAYFGDKMTPLSETTILVPQLVGRGLTTGQHIKNMIWTAGPALGISLVLFFLLGLNAEPEGAVGTEAAQDALNNAFNISAVNLLPLALLVVFAILKSPPPGDPRVGAVRRGPGPLHSVGGGHRLRRRPRARAGRDRRQGQLRRHGHRLRQQLGRRADRRPVLAGRDGQPADHRLADPRRAVVRGRARARRLPAAPAGADRGPGQTPGSLIGAVNASGIGLNVVAGDQYVAVVLPSRVFRMQFARRGLAPRMLSRTVEDTGTVTSPLIPWNSCGAYMTGVLGVATLQYAPWALFNYLNPLIAIGYAATGFRIERLDAPVDVEPASPDPGTAADVPRPSAI